MPETVIIIIIQIKQAIAEVVPRRIFPKFVATLAGVDICNNIERKKKCTKSSAQSHVSLIYLYATNIEVFELANVIAVDFADFQTTSYVMQDRSYTSLSILHVQRCIRAISLIAKTFLQFMKTDRWHELMFLNRLQQYKYVYGVEVRSYKSGQSDWGLGSLRICRQLGIVSWI